MIKHLMRLILSLALIFTLTTPTQAVLAEDGLQVYFLDVDQGDATVAVCEGAVMIVDGGPPSASQFIYSFLRNTLKIDHIDVMIASHPPCRPCRWIIRCFERLFCRCTLYIRNQLRYKSLAIRAPVCGCTGNARYYPLPRRFL